MYPDRILAHLPAFFLVSALCNGKVSRAVNPISQSSRRHFGTYSPNYTLRFYT